MSKLFLYRICTPLLRRNMCTPPTPPSSSSAPGKMHAKFRPSGLQKFILVWTKKFKSKEEIPAFVSADLIERSRSEARIKISNILMLLTALASFGAILAGKAAAKRGESVHQMNLDWHKQYEDDYNKKQAAASSK
ncbi:UPF0389 protein CG9231 [Aphomia sociella]